MARTGRRTGAHRREDTRMWKTGDRLTHRENPGLGPGRVAAVAGRVMDVEFPAEGARLRLAADSPALTLLELRPG